MVNLTPHPIVIKLQDGEFVTVPPSGIVARIGAEEKEVGVIEGGIPVIRRTWCDITGLEGLSDDDGEEYIVSSLVLSAIPNGKEGFYAPDTGDTAIRDENGRIIAVTRLVAA